MLVGQMSKVSTIYSEPSCASTLSTRSNTILVLWFVVHNEYVRAKKQNPKPTQTYVEIKKIKNFTRFVPMSGENRQLVADEPVEFEK